ncbi:MAG: T9SS type A sorting domain-containing protein [Candidatus Eiseniibacteriota bacterium]|nr:MAG: T9SS type A sorting domain-containing protein [Candidatus Eisenbacteria bacterium]
MSRLPLFFPLLFAFCLAFALSAWAVEIGRDVMVPDYPDASPLPPVFYYGGTIWDAGDGRWEAAAPPAAGWVNRKMWTWSASGFGGTPHSGENMDGWSGVDANVDAADHFKVQSTIEIGACVIDGDKSLFCGKTNAECADQCYEDLSGTGYGNLWDQIVVTETYSYVPGDTVRLAYDYASHTEPGHDFMYVILEIFDTVEGRWEDLETLATYDGVMSGSESIRLDPLLSPLGMGVDFRIKFRFKSDSGASDEDGLYPTMCGACAFDNYSLTGDIVDYQTFEGPAPGERPTNWMKLEEACGDFSSVELLADLAVPLSLDPCVAEVPGWCQMADSVLLLRDALEPGYPHPLCQDNYAVSPVIDLSANPNTQGKYIVCEAFADCPLGSYVFMYWRARYAPVCQSGGVSDWLSDGYLYYTREPVCSRWTVDVSGQIPPSAERVQIALGVINLCDEFGLDCDYVCNETPYFDNVCFGVGGPAGAPFITMKAFDYWQDQFAKDGSLSPASTCDTRTAYNLGGVSPPAFGDTLVCFGSADPMEVWLEFRMARVGPGQDESTHAFFTAWFPGITGGGWYGARMDTAEYTDASGASTHPVSGRWMAAFHEADPSFSVEGFEILPNNLFVPGTRFQYFLKARYVGSGVWFNLPPAGVAGPEEFEVLPMMRNDGEGGVEWPPLLVADHFGQTGNDGERNSDRIARHLTAQGYAFDTYNKLAPSQNMKNGLGRWPGALGPGATIQQLVSYEHCILNAGDVRRGSMSQSDVELLDAWLVDSTESVERSLWVSGDQVSAELDSYGWGKDFLNSVLCATLQGVYCSLHTDYTYCLPVDGLAGGRIVCPVLGDPEAFTLRGNCCPRKVTKLGLSGSPGCSAVAEVEYDSQAPPAPAAVSNAVSVVGGPNYRTFLEGYDFCLIRDSNLLGIPSCGPDTYVGEWMKCVLSWSSSIGVPERGAGRASVATLLHQAFPNPVNPSATIRFSVATPGRVELSVFDVSGRVVRTLKDEILAAGEYSVSWDGKNDAGERVSSGVFFYQLRTPDRRSAKKIVILR